MTKQEIEQAAEQYCRENNGGGFEYQAFLQGAELVQADVKKGAKLLAQWVKAYEAEKAENERLRETVQELRTKLYTSTI